MAAYTEEIVWAETEDGLRQEGAVIRPAGGETRPIPVVWIHGLTGRFSERHAILIGRTLAARGHTFVTGNNRGHDVGANFWTRDGRPKRGGGWWEVYEEAPYDVDAWITYAASLGFPRVALLGHSLGAHKVTWYQARRQDPRVAGLIAASPPMRIPDPDPDFVESVRRMVSGGRGEELVTTGDGRGPMSTMSAQTQLSRATTGMDSFGIRTSDAAIATIACPLLIFVGTDEPGIGTAAELEGARRSACASARVDTRSFEGADHVYTGREAEVGAGIADWVATLE